MCFMIYDDDIMNSLIGLKYVCVNGSRKFYADTYNFNQFILTKVK